MSIASLNPSYGLLRELDTDPAETVRCAAFTRAIYLRQRSFLPYVTKTRAHFVTQCALKIYWEGI